jgi:hypothetical protein
MADRDAKGRLLPGHSVKSPGRPPKEKEDAILNAIRDAFTPAELVSILREALIVARNTNSARGMLSSIQTMLDYAVGPAKRIVHDAPMSPTDWLAAMTDDAPASDDNV